MNMNTNLQRPPIFIQQEQHHLREQLNLEIPKKKLDHNLIISTWNLRSFGGLTEKWCAGEHDRPKRDLRSLLMIQEIIQRFDVIAIQEVKGNLKALRWLMKLLGPDWSFLMTDVTRGNKGNQERMAFVFDTRRVHLSGLAGELVLPPETNCEEMSYTQQFARTPYAVSFRSGQATFVLTNLHIYYGKKKTDRLSELHAIAEWVAGWAKQLDEWNHNLIVLGDFNIDRTGDPLYEAFVSTGLSTPPELDQAPRTIFQTARHYDQIAWFTGNNGVPRLSLHYKQSGVFDFSKLVMQDLNTTSMSWRISDHLPVWTEFLLQPPGNSG